MKGPRHIQLRKLQRGFVRVGLGRAVGGPDFRSLLRDLFRRGEPGAVFMAQKPDDVYARRNQLTYSEDFGNAAWTKGQITAALTSAVLAPNGTATAWKLGEVAFNASHQLLVSFPATVPVGARAAESIYLRAAERGYAFVGFQNGTLFYFASVNLATGVATMASDTGAANFAFASEDAGNGWWRVSVAALVLQAGMTFDVRLSTDGVWANRSYLGVVGSGIYAWGAQLERGTVTAYQRVTDWTTEFLQAGIDYTRRNLLSQTGSNLIGGAGSWGGVNLSASAQQPDGSYLLSRTSIVAGSYTSSGILAGIPIGSVVTGQIKVRKGPVGNLYGLRLQGTYPNRSDAVVNLDTGTVAYVNGSTFTGASATVEGPDADGFYTLKSTATVAGSAFAQFIHGPAVVASGGWEGVSAEFLAHYVKEPQLEVSSVASAYQSVTDGSEFIPQVNPRLTMFTDHQGVTPLTALEQTIGFQCDVKPIFVGPNLATNTTIVGDAIGGPTFTNYSTGAIPVPGREYVISFTTTGYGGSGTVGVAGSSPNQWTTTPINNLGGNGTTTYRLVRGTDASAIQVFTRSTNTATFTNVSVREVITSPNAVGQPYRGPETWNNANAIITGTSSIVSPGVFRIYTPDGTITSVVQSGGILMVKDAWYECTFNIDSVTVPGTGLVVDSGLGAGPVIAATVGPKRTIFQAVNPSQLAIKRSSTATDIQISKVSFKRLDGAHRLQATSGARAKLTARYNRALYPNANPIDTTGWTKGGDAAATLTVVDDSAALAAAGLSRYCTLGKVLKLDNSAGATNAYATKGGGLGFTTGTTLSAYMRATGSTRLQTNVGSMPSVAVPQDGAYNLVQSIGTPDATSDQLQVFAFPGAVVYFILFDIRHTCYAHLPTPQIVWDATTGYDDTGFPARVQYLGTQSSVTGSIDFSGTNCSQFFGALAKLDDPAAAAAFMELSSNSGTTAGTFAFFAPRNALTQDAAYRSGGTVPGIDKTVNSAALDAPTAKVFTGLGEIATPMVELRVNGVPSGALVTTSQGTGNYSDNPLYFGSRAAGALPFTGDEFACIVRGGETPRADQLARVERGMAALMGMSL